MLREGEMLGIFELIFFVAGIYMLITGKIPQKEFGILFGKGELQISPGYTRLWALLFILPGPAVILVLIVSLLTFGESGIVAAILFEIVVVIFVIVCSIIIARMVRRPADEAAPQKPSAQAYQSAMYSTGQAQQQPSAPAYQPMGEPLMYSTVQSQPEKPKRSYGMRLLIMTALVVTGCITVTLFTSTIGTLVSGLVYGMRWTDDFMQDIFPIILCLGISVLGIWGIMKLIKLLK
jgi:TRAP-type uncharacterized transport system fused permease subunit